jgi:hypothetical protein
LYAFTLLPKEDKSAIIGNRICVKPDARGGELLKQQASPGIVAGAVVLVVIVIGVMAYMTFGRHSNTDGVDKTTEQYKNYMKGAGSGGGSGGATPTTAGAPKR